MARYPDYTSWLSLTTVAADTATAGFSVPEGVKALTIIAPNLTTDTTFTLQILDPTTQAGGTETWASLNVYDLIDGTNKAVTDIPDNVSVMVFPAPSGAVLRITYTTAQAATFKVIFHK